MDKVEEKQVDSVETKNTEETTSVLTPAPKKKVRGDIKKNFWDKLTPEEKQAHIESIHKKRRESAVNKKLMRDQLTALLSLPVHDKKAIKVLESLGLDVENIDNQMLMLVVMWQQVLKGRANCVPAFNSIVNVLGEGSNNQDINANLHMTFSNDLPATDDLKEVEYE